MLTSIKRATDQRRPIDYKESNPNGGSISKEFSITQSDGENKRTLEQTTTLDLPTISQLLHHNNEPSNASTQSRQKAWYEYETPVSSLNGLLSPSTNSNIDSSSLENLSSTNGSFELTQALLSPEILLNIKMKKEIEAVYKYLRAKNEIEGAEFVKMMINPYLDSNHKSLYFHLHRISRRLSMLGNSRSLTPRTSTSQHSQRLLQELATP